MITDGWVSWAIRVPGPANKIYADDNAGEGIVFHSMEGWYAGSLAELMKPERAASWMFSLKMDGTLIQHYPITASCWASGNRLANTLYWSVELEGIHSMPINDAQLQNALRLIRQWELHTGTEATRDKAWNPPTLWEHREVATIASPNAGPTACPSERYAPLWAALETPEDEVTREEYEMLLLAMYSGKEEIGLPRDQRLTNALYRAQEAAEGTNTSLGERSAGGHTHEASDAGLPDHSHVIGANRTGGVV